MRFASRTMSALVTRFVSSIAPVIMTAMVLASVAVPTNTRAQEESIETLLDEAERTSQLAPATELRTVLSELEDRTDEMHPRQRIRFDLIEIRTIARAGRLAEAADLAIRRLENLEAMDPDLAQRSLNLTTNILVFNDRFDEGFRYFRQALNRATSIDNPRMQADTFSVAAEFYDRIGETATALSYADQALAVARQHDLERQACLALERGGRALLHQGGLAEAASRFRAAVLSCGRAEERVFLGAAQLGLAHAQRLLDQHARADTLIELALDTFQQVQFPDGELEVRVLMAEWALADQARDRALTDADRAALDWLRATNDELERAGDLGVRARAWRLKAEQAELEGSQASALESMRRSMQLRRERSERQRAMRIALLINEHDTEARHRELTLLRDRNRALELENERREQADLGLMYGSGGAVVAAALVVMLLIKTASDRKRFQRMSHHDGLTGLMNHTRFFELAHQAYLRCCQQERPFVIVVADIDLFKQINDGHGHLVGDAILQRAGDCLREVFGESALLGRLGGEEFGIALPGDDTDSAVARIEHLRALINDTRASGEPDITLSFGVAERGRERGLDALYARADQALYDAKDAGRNRVVTVARLALNPARFTT